MLLRNAKLQIEFPAYAVDSVSRTLWEGACAAGEIRAARSVKSVVRLSFAPHGNGVCCWCFIVVVSIPPTGRIVTLLSKYATRVQIKTTKGDPWDVTVFSKSRGATISQDPGWSTSDPIWRRPICRSVNDEPVYRTHLWQGLPEVVRFLRACIPFNVAGRH